MDMRTAVVFCNWKRISNVEGILISLKNQTITDFDTFIWNNNVNDSNQLKELNKKYDFRLFDSDINVGGIGRFYACREILEDYDCFIFFDDDQVFDNKFVENMLLYYEPKTLKSRYGWKLTKLGYFHRTRITNNTLCTYCGTGGMIGDMSLFKHKEIYEIPQKYVFIEDLWLSYISDIKGYKTYGIPETLVQLNDGKDQFYALRELKNEFFLVLIKEHNWLI